MMTSTSKFTTAMRKFLGATALQLFIETEPTPASRPRVTRWGTFYGKKYEAFRREVKTLLVDHDGQQITGPVHAFIAIVCSPPKTTKRQFPRGDVDNFAKGPLDSMTTQGKFWKDDDQITALAVVKRFAEPNEVSGIHIMYKEVTE